MRPSSTLRIAALAGVCALGAAPTTVAQRPESAAEPAERVHALSGVTLIDGTGAAPRAGVTLVMRGAVITRIEDELPDDLPADAEVVDLRGQFCVPGLIDAHTHLATDPSAEGYTAKVHDQLRHLLGRGITDVRDMGGDGRVLAYLARQTGVGDIPGPDIHFAALLAGPRFFQDRRARSASRGAKLGFAPWAHQVTDDTDLDALMQRIEGCGATGIKIYADLDPDLTTRTAAAARAHGLLVWAHWVVAPRLTGARDTVRAGVEVVSHAYMLMHDVSPAERASSAKVLAGAGGSELLQEMHDRATILDATLIAAAGLRAPPAWVDPGTCAGDIVRAARAAGVRVATGSDHPGDGTLPGIHLEYALLVEDAGFSPLEVIEAATRVSAQALGIEATRGTLEVGKDATMILLDADPAASVAALAEPAVVIKRGVIYSGSNLREQGTPVVPLEKIPPAGAK